MRLDQNCEVGGKVETRVRIWLSRIPTLRSCCWRWSRQGTDEAWEDFSRARNYKNNLIKREQRKTFQKFIREICESPAKMWKGIRWARDPTPKQVTLSTLIPLNIIIGINDPPGKADILWQTFFPPPVQADLSDLEGVEYPLVLHLGPITRDEINRAIQKAPVSKAPGNDGILNGILKLLWQDLFSFLHHLFNSSLTLGYYLTRLKDSVVIAL